MLGRTVARTVLPGSVGGLGTGEVLPREPAALNRLSREARKAMRA